MTATIILNGVIRTGPNAGQCGVSLEKDTSKREAHLLSMATEAALRAHRAADYDIWATDAAAGTRAVHAHADRADLLVSRLQAYGVWGGVPTMLARAARLRVGPQLHSPYVRRTPVSL